MSKALKRERWLELGLVLSLFVGYLVVLLLTANALGYARDEGFYFDAARSYGKWFHILLSDPSRAFERDVVDRFWRVNHEHPALMKSLSALSRDWFFGLPLLDTPGKAFRLPGMLLSSLAVALTYVWSRAFTGRWAALGAALAFGFMPRVFYHAHLNCFDMPVLSMWLVTSYVYWRSTQHKGWLWPALSAILYGLLLNTKHNSWILPGALVLHTLLGQRSRLGSAVRIFKLRIPVALFLMATISPLLFYATWPWIWSDTYHRLVEYVKFHTHHVYYNMEFLGQTYFKPPMPRLYAWVMTVATVPAIVLASFGGGIVFWGKAEVAPRLSSLVGKVRLRFGQASSTPAEAEAEDVDLEREKRHATLVFWALCIFFSYLPWWFTKTPIFGGTKHWLTAYPYMCLFAALFLERAIVKAREWTSRPPLQTALAAGLGATLALPSIVMGIGTHPWGLGAYTPLVGGAPGAATLGLNRSFWGYTTGALVDDLNRAPKGSRVFVHDTAYPSWDMLVKDGTLKKGLRPWGSVHGSDFALYHHEQHMSRVEFMIWVDYGTVSPKAIGTYDGVPVVWLYQRP